MRGFTNVTSTAMTLAVTQQEGNVPTICQYEICFRIPSSVVGSEQIALFPAQFALYMASAENRADFEERLRMAGIDLVTSSLMAATIVGPESPPPRSKSSNTAASVGGTVAGGLASLLW